MLLEGSHVREGGVLAELITSDEPHAAWVRVLGWSNGRGGMGNEVHAAWSEVEAHSTACLPKHMRSGQVGAYEIRAGDQSSVW